MNASSTTVLLVCLLATVPIVNGFYLFFPQANDRILALEMADQARVPQQITPEEALLVDQIAEEMQPAKRTAASRGSMRRRSADGYHCPCLHKVCTYHCMTK